MKKKPKKWGRGSVSLIHCKSKILKAYLALTLTCMLHVSASVESQVLNVDLKVTNTELRSVIDAIEEQCEYVFFFNENDVNVYRKLNVSLEKADIDEVVKKVFGRDSEYRVAGKLIVISRKESLVTNSNVQTQRTISGIITDNNGAPLPGVNVIILNTNKGVSSDFDGKYSIEANTGDVLSFSYIGMKTTQLTVDASDTMNVVMTEDADALDEIVVIGYGTQRKADVTGSMVSVTSEDFKAQPMISSTDALQGRASGVFVGATNGAPGGASKIVIRGANSISGSSSPLIVIDGILGGSLENINPSEIASMEVLKDASSTAIFGSRGANGVILITTKNGTSNGTKINFDTFYGIQNISKRINLLSAADFAREVNASSLATGGGGDIYSAQEINNLQSTGGTDWQDELFRSASTQNYQLSVGGKLDKTDYYISGNHSDTDGILINTNFKRYNLRTKVNTQLSDKLKVGVNMSFLSAKGRNNQNRSSVDSPIYGALAFDPTMSIYADDGSYNLTSIKGVGTLGVNPVAQLLENNLDTERTLTSLNAYLDYEIVDGLVFNLTGGTRINKSADRRFSVGLNGPSSASIFNGDSRLNQGTARLTFEKAIKDHRFKIDAIYEIQDSKWNSSNIRGTDLTYPTTTYNNIGTAENVVSSSFASETQIESVMGRLNYSFQDKYIITGAIRRDGASVLADGNKFDVFPSGAVAWRVSEENFLKDSKLFYRLKLRASYGITGNQSIGPYQSFATLATGPRENYPFDDAVAVIGAGPSRVANPGLGWEKTAQFDVGLDATFLNGRLDFVFDYYKKETSDLLMNVPTAGYRGGLVFTDNIGDIENTGYEFGISGEVMNTPNFKWDTNFNIAFNETIVTNLGDNEEFFAGERYGGGQAVGPAVILQVGERTGNFWGYLYDGVWQSSEAAEALVFGNVPGDAKYKDINGDGTINNDDLGVMGNGQPDFVWGFNNSFSYGGFDFNVFFQGVHGNDIWNLGRGYIFGGTGDARNATTSEIKNKWTPQNENTNIPGYSSTSSNIIQSSRYVEDGSFVRMKNISLGYTLPTSFLERSGIFDTIRIYVSGQNLLTITDYSGFDPEISNTGTSSIDQSIDYGAYPTSKTFTLGLNLTF